MLDKFWLGCQLLFRILRQDASPSLLHLRASDTELATNRLGAEVGRISTKGIPEDKPAFHPPSRAESVCNSLRHEDTRAPLH